MTHRMTFLAIAAIATTTFMSSFAHAFNIKITDKAGTSHDFDITTPHECKKFDAVIVATEGKTDAGVCYLYESDDCSSNSEDDRVAFGSEGADILFSFDASSVLCK